MSTTILATKLHIPPPRSRHVARPRLIARLDEGAERKLTLVSAPAGFGKTTLVSAWVAGARRPAAWLSLDPDDNDPARFLTYLVAALARVHPGVGHEVARTLQLPQPPQIDAVLTALINELAAVAGPFTLVLDDYHAITSRVIDQALAFLLERSPPHLRLLIATREDPGLPLHRLRARDELIELRAADLRFTHAEAAEFLTQSMGLRLTANDVAALETRTEGWIAGLQLAALSMQGVDDAAQFIRTFAGSHRYVLDYLLEEVLHKQSEDVQHFLLHTSILERMCGPLCDAVLDAPAGAGQARLESLEQANSFVIPLDDERRWYRYHHLFADLLRHRLGQSLAAAAPEGSRQLHRRASQWFEDQGLELEAFHHAAAAHDVERAERLIDGKGIPLHLRGAAMSILNWLQSLPPEVLNARPSLWWRQAALMLINGQTTGVDEKLDAAEAAVQGADLDAETRNLIGRIAGARATLALTRYQVDAMLEQSRRALEHLKPEALSARANAHWVMGYAHFLHKDRAAAGRAFSDGVALGQAANAPFSTILAVTGLGNVQEANNQLHLAAQTYRSVLQLTGDQPLQIIYDAHLGLARVHYEWNDLDVAQRHGELSLQLARQYDAVIDRFVVCELFLARLKLARGDVAGADEMVAQTSRAAREGNFVHRIPEVAATHVLILLRQGRHAEALQIARDLSRAHALTLAEALAHLAQGDAAAALALLEPALQRADANGWADERLNLLALHALAWHQRGQRDRALGRLGEALALAEPEGFIRLFLDKGPPMARLLAEAKAHGVMPDYVGRLLAAFDAEPGGNPGQPGLAEEPLSARELEVLRLIAQGLSNNEISARLFLALDTVKGHNRRIFEKLGVQRRTEAVARARELGLV